MDHGKHKSKKMPMRKMMHSENEMGGMMKKMSVTKKQKKSKKRRR